jgi:signal transduction histidine kinase
MKGFDVNTYTDIEVGNGLANMRKRVAETGVQLQINSIPGEGTEIKLVI